MSQNNRSNFIPVFLCDYLPLLENVINSQNINDQQKDDLVNKCQNIDFRFQHAINYLNQIFDQLDFNDKNNFFKNIQSQLQAFKDANQKMIKYWFDNFKSGIQESCSQSSILKDFLNESFTQVLKLQAEYFKLFFHPLAMFVEDHLIDRIPGEKILRLTSYQNSKIKRFLKTEISEFYDLIQVHNLELDDICVSDEHREHVFDREMETTF